MSGVRTAATFTKISIQMAKNRTELQPATQGQPAAGNVLPFGVELMPQETPARLRLRRTISAVLRHKWLVLLISILGSGIGFYAVRFIKPEYVAQVMFWVEVSDGRERGPIRSTELLRSAAWVDLLKAYTVLDYAVKQERLFINYVDVADSVLFRDFQLHEDFRPGTYQLEVDPTGKRYRLLSPQGRMFENGAVGDTVGKSIGVAWLPSGRLPAERLIEFSVTPPRDAARQLAGRLNTEMPENGNFLRLELRGTNPTRIASVLNTIADRYVSVAADLKRQKLRELATILDEQLTTAGANLRGAELALEGFRVSTVTLPTESSAPIAAGLEETRDPVLTNFFNLKIEREQIRRDRDAINRALSDARDSSALAMEALQMVPAVKSSSELNQSLQELAAKRSELRTLRTKFTNEHTQVRQLIAQIEMLERHTIRRLANELVNELTSRETKLEGLVATASGELRAIPQRANEEAKLRREVAVAEQLYTTLQARYEEARLATASSVPDVRILDAAAVPDQPINDTRIRMLMLAILGSMALALITATILDRFDARVRYPEQVTQGLGLDILGAIPQTGRRKEKTTEDVSQLAESFRELLLNVRNASGAMTPLTIAITSPGPGDGKTFTSSNLALRSADDGNRTLLIDGDVRRGAQHKVFGMKRKPGLTDYLAARMPYTDVIQSTSHSTLDVIPCGTHMQDGPKLLSSQRMLDLLEFARATYDVIVVDTAPLGAGVDPVVLGSLAGQLMLVLRTGITDRELAQNKLEMLDRMPVNVIGAVLNAVPQHAVYGYYAYSAGYEARDEEPQPSELEPVMQGR